ncbi:MAG: hypothetical protein AAF996_14100 [Pseudomonadota bacterium]
MSKIISNDDADAAAFSILQSRGFRLRRELNSENGVEYDIAESELGEFWGLSPVEVLGLVQMHQKRGENWQPNKQEIRHFADFDKDRQKEIRNEIREEIVSELAKPKTLITFVLGVMSGLRMILMISFAAVYFNYHLDAASAVSWITLALAIAGIWKCFDSIERIADFYISKTHGQAPVK